MASVSCMLPKVVKLQLSFRQPQDSMVNCDPIHIIIYFIQGALNFEEKTTRNNAHEVSVTTKDVLKHIADLLSVSEEDLEKTLCFRVVAAGGDVVSKGHTEKEAVFAKDAFAKVN